MWFVAIGAYQHSATFHKKTLFKAVNSFSLGWHVPCEEVLCRGVATRWVVPTHRFHTTAGVGLCIYCGLGVLSPLFTVCCAVLGVCLRRVIRSEPIDTEYQLYAYSVFT